jgi:hypothetical protein
MRLKAQAELSSRLSKDAILPSLVGQINCAVFAQHVKYLMRDAHKLPARKKYFHQAIQTDDRNQALSAKYFCFSFIEFVFFSACPASAMRGASRSSRALGAGCGGRVVLQRGCHADEQHGAHGEIVWSWHPDADAKPR